MFQLTLKVMELKLKSITDQHQINACYIKSRVFIGALDFSSPLFLVNKSNRPNKHFLAKISVKTRIIRYAICPLC